MVKKKVLLVNGNRVQSPGIFPYGVWTLESALRDEGIESVVLDTCFLKDQEIPEKIDEAIFDLNIGVEDIIVGYSARNVFSINTSQTWDAVQGNAPRDESSFIPGHRNLTQLLGEKIPFKNIVMGGAGFSIFPEVMLKRTGAKIGVIGAGERVLPQIVRRLESGGSIEGLPYVLQEGGGYIKGKMGLSDFNASLNVSPEVLLKYEKTGGTIAFRISNGCLPTKKCSYCPETFSKGELCTFGIEGIMDQIKFYHEAGVRNLHFANSQDNIFPKLFEEVCERISQEGLNDINYWCYMQPKPVTHKMIAVAKKANVKGIYFGSEHVDDSFLRRGGRDYIYKDIVKATTVCGEEGLPALAHSWVFGLPGESRDSIFRAHEKALELRDIYLSLNPSGVYVSESNVGIGLYPRTPLVGEKVIQDSLSERDPVLRGEKYGVFCSGIPLEDPTIFLDTQVKFPEILSDLRSHYNSELKHLMIPAHGKTISDYDLINSPRVALSKKPGSYWAQYPEIYEKSIA